MNDTGSKQTQHWEKAWTTDELRKNSGNWTLAGDSGLLNGLEGLSQKILARTDDVQKDVDSLVQESKASGSQIYNAINDFLMLSNTQFVENRVYDEEIQDELGNADKKNHSEKLSKEEREAELVPRIREAVQLGLNVIESAFEKHHVSDSESDEEHEDHAFHTLPLLKPKDFYIDRPLPYIIGSDKFMQDDSAGLGELYSDDEEIEESDKEEVTKENNLNIDSEDSETEDEPEMNHIQRFEEKKKNDSDDGGDLFAPSEDEFGYDGEDDDGDASSSKSESQTLNNAADFAAELAAKLGATQHSVIDEDYVADTSTPGKSKRKESKVVKSKRDRGSSKLSARGSEVSVEISDDEFSPFGKTTKTFSTGGGLFDDFGDEDNDLFTENSSIKSKEINARKDSKVSVSKTSKKSSISLFEDDNNDLFTSPKMDTENDSGVAPSTHRSTKTSLFNETDDDDDLFGSASLPKKKSAVDNASSLFDETDNASDDLSSGISEPRVGERSSSESTPRKKLPGAFSIFGVATSSISEALKAHRAMSDSDKESEGDWLGSSKEHRSPSKLSSPPRKIEIESKKEEKVEKSDNEKEENKDQPKDELFSASANKENATRLVTRKISLFDDDDDDDEDLFAAPAVTTRSQGKVEVKSKLDEVKPKLDEVKPKLDEVKPKLDDIKPKMDDVKQQGVEVKTKVEEVKQENKKDKPSEAISSPKSKKEISLFDDDDDDDSVDIFKTATKPKERTSSGKLRTSSLFDEENALFGGPTEEAPSVDLFKAPDAGTTKNKPPVSLFDETDDGLFSSKTSDSKGRPPIPTPRRTSLPRDEPSNTSTNLGAGSPKKGPFGGVSLFGGIDPFAEKMKRNSSSGESPKKEVTPSIEKSPVSSRKSSALLSMDVIQQPHEISNINLDEPAEVRTLRVVSKERAKIQTKRRLPTRKARKAATQSVFGDETDGVSSINTKSVEKEDLVTEKESDKMAESEKESEKEFEKDFEKEVAAEVISPSTEEEDLLPVDELIGTKLTPPTVSKDALTKEKESVKSVSNLDSDLFGDLNSGADDIFSTRTKKPTEPIDDIFSSASKAKTKTNLLLSDDDDDLDDLFATSKTATKKATTQKVETKRETTPKREPKKVDSKKETKSKSLFDTESDSDDIFADLEPKKQTTTTKTKLTSATQSQKQTKASLFDDDDDDDNNIFNDPLMVKLNK